MALEAFLKIEGIPGESRREGHADEIDILSFSFGASNPTTVAKGSGAGASQVSISSFNIMKTTDLTSWTKVLRFQDIAGPVECPAGTRQHDQCVYDCPDMTYDMDPAQCPNLTPRSWCPRRRYLLLRCSCR